MTQLELAPGKGTSIKCSDLESVPMCWNGNVVEWGENKGAFAGWTKNRRREWATGMIKFYQALHAMQVAA